LDNSYHYLLLPNTEREMKMNTDDSIVRELVATTAGTPATDGDGVKMTRVIGSQELNMLDPFLLLDAFESDQPHRGIVHSEMPEQENGLLMGFQLWVNLPARAKMSNPGYQEFPPSQTPLEMRDDGTEIRVIAGTTSVGTQGVVKNEFVHPTYLDVVLPAGRSFEQSVSETDNSFLFVIDGELEVGTSGTGLGSRMLGILGEGENVAVSTASGARFLLVSAQPLKEPVARGGPFVMNTKEEIMQAFDDYKHNRF
jgi:redox-sensitive bicupin YhaK (pirin superfamily)